ncbi:MAG: nuclear transport factor 2 family protein [Acidobacteria bacterium]|nr:nuclear transport factor 2 family protein [Acidobacteriota bacterium]MBI3427495.1 nuclear transport factor 2 family protein [Acidobacteriota bacterium]
MNKILQRGRWLALLLSLLLTTVVAQPEKLSAELQVLAEAERAFARLCVAQGVRASFMAFFAPDAINFQPGPVNAQEALAKRPAPTGPLPTTLDWRPVWGALSAAGDMGCNTGPYTVTDNTPAQRPTQHGLFFSVWKKQSDGSWKVAVDIGTPTLTAVTPLQTPYQRIGNRKVVATKREPAAAATLQSVESEFLQALQQDGLVTAYLNHVSADARLHRTGKLPAVGKEAIRQSLSEKPLALTFSILKTDLARSGDFGWTLGKYELKDKPGTVAETGHFVHVWQRNEKGVWKLLADITNPLPTPKP